MVVAVFLTLHDKLAVIPGQEDDGMLGLHVFGRCLTVELGDLITRQGVVADQSTVVLVTVQLKHIDDGALGVPGDIREIAVGGVTGLEVDRLATLHVVHADRHFV